MMGARRRAMMAPSVIAPETMRIVANVAASIAPGASARRQVSEFAAKAIIATMVRVAVWLADGAGGIKRNEQNRAVMVREGGPPTTTLVLRGVAKVVLRDAESRGWSAFRLRQGYGGRGRGP